MRKSILGICLGLGIIFAPITVVHSLPETVQQKIDNGREAMLRGDYNKAIDLLEEAKKSLISRRSSETVDVEAEILIDNYLSLGYQEIGDLAKAETAIASATQRIEDRELNSNLVAKVLNTQANLNLKQDDPHAAALNFREAKNLYRENKDKEGEIGTAINEAIALQKLGKYRTAEKILEKVETELADLPTSLQAAGYKALGTTYATIGNFTAAKEKLEASIALTQSKDREATAKTKIDLAAVIQFSEPETATELLQEVASTSQNPEVQAIALLNAIDIEIEEQDWDEAITIVNNSEDLILNLPHHEFAKIDLIKKMAKLDSYTASKPKQQRSLISSLKLLVAKPADNLISNRHQQLLKQIAQSAQSQGAKRTESYAIGTLAYIEEQQGNLNSAIALNQSALSAAEAIAAEDIAYQWQWQLGRIFKSQGETNRAIVSYQNAVDNLGQIRADLVSFNPESQYSFRESVEPVYRQLVELLISQPTQENLIQARNTIESLQMAELENYFRQACLRATPQQIDEIDNTAATIYPIVTEEKLAVLTSIPGQPIKLHVQSITAENVADKVIELMGHFNQAGSTKRRKAISQEFYSWLVEPTLKELTAANIETLVFVLDSGMRSWG